MPDTIKVGQNRIANNAVTANAIANGANPIEDDNGVRYLEIALNDNRLDLAAFFICTLSKLLLGSSQHRLDQCPFYQQAQVFCRNECSCSRYGI